MLPFGGGSGVISTWGRIASYYLPVLLVVSGALLVKAEKRAWGVFLLLFSTFLLGFEMGPLPYKFGRYAWSGLRLPCHIHVWNACMEWPA